MRYFYSNQIDGKTIYFSPEESQHLLKSMRVKVGDAITVLNGKGTIYDGIVTVVTKRSVEAQIQSERSVNGDQYQLTIFEI